MKSYKAIPYRNQTKLTCDTAMQSNFTDSYCDEHYYSRGRYSPASKFTLYKEYL